MFGLVMRDHPNGALSLTADVEWDEQGVLDRGCDLAYVGEISLWVRKKKRFIQIENGAAWPKLARRSTSQKIGPSACYCAPMEAPLLVSLFR